MFNNSNENKVRRRNVSSSGGSSSNRIRRPDNSYDEERLRENTKSKPLFERTANDDFKRGNTGKIRNFREKMERDCSLEVTEDKIIGKILIVKRKRI